MNVDILQEQHQWKLGLKSIRDIVRQVEEKVIHLFYIYSTYSIFVYKSKCKLFSSSRTAKLGKHIWIIKYTKL